MYEKSRTQMDATRAEEPRELGHAYRGGGDDKSYDMCS